MKVERLKIKTKGGLLEAASNFLEEVRQGNIEHTVLIYRRKDSGSIVSYGYGSLEWENFLLDVAKKDILRKLHEVIEEEEEYE